MPVTADPLDRLRQQLVRRAPASATELAEALGVSVPTLHRLLQRLPAGQWLSAGKARRARHALARPLRGSNAPLPVYAVDADGQLHDAGTLRLRWPEGSWMALEGSGWPVPAEARDGWWPGLPYPLYQMRPQGYMGRQFARAEHRRLQVPANVQEWSDDDVLFAISQAGSDLSGQLIVGEAACEQWLAERAAGMTAVPAGDTVAHYVEQASHAVAAGVAGSSAAGEFPKFTARRALAGAATPHVIVKFSGVAGSGTVQRWSDLLRCEHHALVQARALPGVATARSRVLAGGGRTFLEVERFDRHGDFGRSPLVALDVVNAVFLGESRMAWPHLAARLQAEGLIAASAVAAIERLWWFGRLIANTDMHTGNLSFRPAQGRFELAPAYDMLPMGHAPLPGGEVPQREVAPELPLPPQRAAWHDACEAALAFWAVAQDDAAISPAFRDICGQHLQALRGLRQRA